MKTLLFIFFVITTRSLADEVVPDSPAEMTVSGIRQWQKDGGMSQYGWIKEYSEDLNGDKQPEIFLAVGGFGRGADYAVFTEDQSSWKFIGYTSFGNLLIRVLPAKKETGTILLPYVLAEEGVWLRQATHGMARLMSKSNPKRFLWNGKMANMCQKIVPTVDKKQVLTAIKLDSSLRSGYSTLQCH